MAENLLSTAVRRTMPVNYVRPESKRPRLAEVVSGARIPVVDLASPDRAAVVADIGGACRTHGFFQVLNHGIDAGLFADVMAVSREFFRLPAEEKAKLYSGDDPARKIRLSTSFNNVRKETVHNWRDYLRLHCHPLDQFVPVWPSNPPDFKYIITTFAYLKRNKYKYTGMTHTMGPWPFSRAETMSSYRKEVRKLGFRLYAAISESLGLEPSYMKEMLGEQEQHVAVNFYPPCPSPEFTYGLPAHTDPNALTILLMYEDVAGLQVLRGRKWVAVNLQPGALIINIGDQMQAAISDGQYPHPGAVIIGISDDMLLQIRGEKSAGGNKAGDPIPPGTKKASGEDDGRGDGHRRGRGSLAAVLGIVAASSAIHAVAVGAITPVVVVGSAVVLFVGVSVVMAGFLQV